MSLPTREKFSAKISLHAIAKNGDQEGVLRKLRRHLQRGRKI